jgi:hypothetical protein
LLCVLRYDQFWRRFQGLLTRIYIMQKLHEILRRHQLGLFDLCCDLNLEFLYWFFCLDDLSIGDRGIVKSPTTAVLESTYVFRYFRVCVMTLGVLMLDAYRLVIFISFCCISPFVSMECPSWS